MLTSRHDVSSSCIAAASSVTMAEEIPRRVGVGVLPPSAPEGASRRSTLAVITKGKYGHGKHRARVHFALKKVLRRTQRVRTEADDDEDDDDDDGGDGDTVVDELKRRSRISCTMSPDVASRIRAKRSSRRFTAPRIDDTALKTLLQRDAPPPLSAEAQLDADLARTRSQAEALKSANTEWAAAYAILECRCSELESANREWQTHAEKLTSMTQEFEARAERSESKLLESAAQSKATKREVEAEHTNAVQRLEVSKLEARLEMSLVHVAALENELEKTRLEAHVSAAPFPAPLPLPLLRPTPPHQISLPSAILQSGRGGVSIKAGVVSMVGRYSADDEDGEKKKNQDAFFVIDAFDDTPGQWVIALFDGHGSNGHIVSKYVRDALPGMLMQRSRALACRAEAPAALIECHEELQLSLKHTLGTKICSLSGTTSTCVLVRGRTLFCSSVGDSGAFIGRVKRGSGNAASIEVIRVAVDHKPEEPSERARIEAGGGQVRAMTGYYSGVPEGPLRVWAGDSDQWPGLAMSRSIGDLVAHQLGVIATPDVVAHDLERGDEFIVLASDGIWDQLDPEEALGIVYGILSRPRKNSAKRAARALAKAARAKWEIDGEDGYIDDVTCIVVTLTQRD